MPSKASTVALVGSACLALAGAVAAPPASASSAGGRIRAAGAACANVLFVGARGSGELGPGDSRWKATKGDPDGLGPAVNGAYRRLLSDLGGRRTLQVMSVRYVANGVQTLLHAPNQYFANLSDGVAWTLHALGTQAARCPGQQIVLAGFSQGAMVMHRVLRDLASTSASRPVLSRVMAAVLVGDGDQIPDDNQIRFGTAALNARGAGRAVPKISHTSDAKFPRSLATKVLSVCNKHDIVCGWTDKNLAYVRCIVVPATCAFSAKQIAAMIAIHLGYPASKPLDDAADQAADDVRSQPLAQGITIDAGLGEPLRYQLTADVLPTVTLQWRATPATTLPFGLKLSASGLVTGTPGGAGRAIASIQVRNAKSPVYGAWTTAAVTVSVGRAGTAIKVPGLAALNAGGDAQVNSVSCASAGNCTAGGYYTSGSQQQRAFATSEVSGTWHDAQRISGITAVEAISCPSAGACTLIGDNGVAAEANGTWQDARPVPGLDALGGGTVQVLSCPSARNCTAAGDLDNRQAFVVSKIGGTWQRARKIPGLAALNVASNANVTSVSCASAGSCVVVGSYSTQRLPDGFTVDYGFLAEETGSTWQNAIEVPGLNALEPPTASQAGGGTWADSVSCAAPGNCVISGGLGLIDDYTYGFTAIESDGSWQNAAQIPGQSAGVIGGAASSITCLAAGECSVLGGSYTTSVAAGTVQDPTPISVPSGYGYQYLNLSCGSTGNCLLGGGYWNSSGQDTSQGSVITELNGSWENAMTVPGLLGLETPAGPNGDPSSVNDVSCPSGGYCAAGGYYEYWGGHNYVRTAFVTK